MFYEILNRNIWSTNDSTPDIPHCFLLFGYHKLDRTFSSA